MKVVFAGDREISVHVLDYLLAQGVEPLALLVPTSGRASHADNLVSLCSYLESGRILRGTSFREPQSIAMLKGLDPEYIICIHFPYLVPKEVLAVPRGGVVNLHPAYLPFNRGWHTPSWAILEQTPIGATLHFMDTGVDTGDIIHQAALAISPGDTAHTLYGKLVKLEVEVFVDAWPRLVSGMVERKAQQLAKGSFHGRQDLFEDTVQRIDLDEEIKAVDLIRKLRALTTNQLAEAAYFEEGGKRFRIQVLINEED